MSDSVESVQSASTQATTQTVVASTATTSKPVSQSSGSGTNQLPASLQALRKEHPEVYEGLIKNIFVAFMKMQKNSDERIKEINRKYYRSR